ncbi:MAG TPA: hypothetical protein VMQ81_04245 [Acidimicrobiia bacterium]|nr:hypothetical protein [Acidimicrobiia bacterium]
MGKRVWVLVSVVALGVALTAPAAGAGDADEEAQAVIDDVLLTGADAPAGYEEVEFREAPIPDASECKGFRRSEKQERKQPQGGVIFGDPNGPSFVSDEVVVFPKAKAAKRYARGYADGEDCLETVFTEAFSGAGFEGIAPRFDDLGDQTISYSFILDFPEEGAQLVVDIVLVRVGAVVTGLNFQGVGAPMPEADAIVELTVERMEEAA